MMKSLQDRVWLVLLGVVVAVLVMLTTVIWSEPSASRPGSGSGITTPAAQRAFLPRLTTRVLQAIAPSRSARK